VNYAEIAKPKVVDEVEDEDDYQVLSKLLSIKKIFRLSYNCVYIFRGTKI
jgi:hypothetical protein